MEDEEVKEYIRMRDDHKKSLKSIKHQILALLLRQGYKYIDGKNEELEICFRVCYNDTYFKTH